MDTNINLIHNPNIPGWANPQILDVLGTYAQAVPINGAILEIGGLFGRSTYTLGKNKHESVKMITIDVWPDVILDEAGRRRYELHDYKCGIEELELLYRKIINVDGSRRLSSKDFFGMWSYYTRDVPNLSGIVSRSDLDNKNFPMFDLIYQDALHDYIGVYTDLVHWFPKLKPGGVLIVDDYAIEGWPGVVQAVDQFVKENNLDTIMVTQRNILLRK